MSLHNLFDNYSENLTFADEDTVITDTGVNYDNIKHMVFNEIGTRKNRRVSKKIIIPLVAIITTLAILTTTGYAIGSFEEIFGYMFSKGQNNNLSIPDNVKTTSSNSDLVFDVLGITGGNKTEFCVAYKIAKSDGSDFLNNLNEYEISFSEGPNLEISSSLFELNNNDSYSVEQQIFTPDNNTIIIIQALNQTNKAIGQHMDVEFNNLTFKKIDKYLNIYTDNDPYSEEFDATIKDLEKKYSLNNNQIIDLEYDYNKEKYEYCIVTQIKYDVTLSASLDLNYKLSYHKLTPNKKVVTELHNNNEFEIRLDNCILSPFSIKIDGTFKHLNTNNSNISDYMPLGRHGKIIMKNGDSYTIEDNTSGFNSIASDNSKYEYHIYYNIEFPTTEKQPLINIDEVKEIVIGDITLTPN